MAAEYRERQEAAERKLQDERYKEIRSSVQLYEQDRREVDAEATDMARRDLAAGRIHASDLGKTIERYAKDLTEKRKDSKAASMSFNEILRNARRGNTING